MADQEIFANVSGADAKGRRTVEAAEHYGYLLTWMRGAVRAAIGAAGHPLVAEGYEAFRGNADPQVQRLHQHGIDAGSNLRTSAGIVSGTDADNAGTFGAAAGLLGAAAADPNGGHRG